MKKLFVIQFLMLLVGVCYVSDSKAESFTITKNGKERLSSFFPETSRFFVTDLKIVGEINNSDIKFIQSIAKGDGNLSNLDLSDAIFVDADSLESFIYENGIQNGSKLYSSDANHFELIPYIWSDEYDYYTHRSYFGYYIVYRVWGGGEITINTIQYTGFDVIPKYMFIGCEKLKKVILPPHITAIGDYAFYECKNLEEISIPTNVNKIGENAFYGCVKLREIDLPQTLTSIGSNAFEGCTTLSSIIIPDNVNTMGFSIFKNCTGIQSAKLPDNLETVPWGLFEKCKNLKAANIPQSCRIIKTYAFDGCGLDSVIIPESVKQIELGAFSCPFNRGVYAMPEMPPSYDNKNSWGNVILYVPKGCVERYSLSPGWKEFGTILEMPDLNNKKCEKPTISYKNNEIVFYSGTEDVKFVSTITDTDIKTYSSNKIELSATYIIKVYASKVGYEDSEVTTATLCWMDAEPKSEGLSDGISQIRSKALLIQADNGQITITGTEDGTKVNAYEVNGQQIGSVISHNGYAKLNTNLKSGSIAILKIGDRSVKFVIK